MTPHSYPRHGSDQEQTTEVSQAALEAGVRAHGSLAALSRATGVSIRTLRHARAGTQELRLSSLAAIARSTGRLLHQFLHGVIGEVRSGQPWACEILEENILGKVPKR